MIANLRIATKRKSRRGQTIGRAPRGETESCPGRDLPTRVGERSPGNIHRTPKVYVEGQIQTPQNGRTQSGADRCSTEIVPVGFNGADDARQRQVGRTTIEPRKTMPRLPKPRVGGKGSFAEELRREIPFAPGGASDVLRPYHPHTAMTVSVRVMGGDMRHGLTNIEVQGKQAHDRPEREDVGDADRRGDGLTGTARSSRQTTGRTWVHRITAQVRVVPGLDVGTFVLLCGPDADEAEFGDLLSSSMFGAERRVFTTGGGGGM